MKAEDVALVLNIAMDQFATVAKHNAKWSNFAAIGAKETSHRFNESIRKNAFNDMVKAIDGPNFRRMLIEKVRSILLDNDIEVENEC